ncbi:FxLD family lanthipeptide [Glycomyces xiaoerkulensis]|uniref:FxLD family lanthipeptide n=1 Tax=Glycomyces xiaoerkulensis TaxID=2038139 RepID=UPI000C25F1EF|nr:FxLD family lanthipeptide [Glycomyces xiaoerkulensis]
MLTPLAEPETSNAVIEDDDFALDLRIVESHEPIAQLRCDTDDGCGNTCQGSACASFTNNPV